MSTRCQVKVTDGADSITLYHHTDGYPSYMIPKIREAWETYGKGWEGARVGKVASMLCAVDPVVFEPEESHDLHMDIEYYYVIDCKDTAHIGTKPVWTVKAYGVDFDQDRLSLLAEGKIDTLDGELIETD
jgi:hypothetical protein